MVDGVHGALILHVPRLVGLEQRKERGNVTILPHQTAAIFALVILELLKTAILIHAQVNS